MSKPQSTLIAIGGGEIADSGEILDELLEFVKKGSDPRLVVMTVATGDPERAANKYNALFRKRGVKHVDTVDISQREDSYSASSIKKINNADALFFTGGDQLNITTLLGGSELDQAIRERVKEGIVLAGTSAGAAMMSKWMIISGSSDEAPRVGHVSIAPGMDLFDSMIIDTHFSQRGRHGRLLNAVAHFPQALGVGIDETTAIVMRNGDFRVIGDGVVTIINGNNIRLNDLPYKKEGEAIGISGAVIDVLPAGYKYHLKHRETFGPALTTLAHQG